MLPINAFYAFDLYGADACSRVKRFMTTEIAVPAAGTKGEQAVYPTVAKLA